MLSLMVKDFYLLKNQKLFFMVLFLMVCFILQTGQQPFLATMMVTMVLSMFVITTIAYDEYDKGMSFLMTLPSTKKDYVLSKYVFSIINTLVTCTIMCFITLIYCFVVNRMNGIQDYLLGTFSAVLGSQLFVSLIIPMNLKFGSEKARFVMIGFFVMISFIGFLLKDLLINISEELGSVFYGMNDFMILIIVACVIVVIWLMSLSISIKIMNKKEF